MTNLRMALYLTSLVDDSIVPGESSKVTPSDEHRQSIYDAFGDLAELARAVDENALSSLDLQDLLSDVACCARPRYSQAPGPSKARKRRKAKRVRLPKNPGDMVRQALDGINDCLLAVIPGGDDQSDLDHLETIDDLLEGLSSLRRSWALKQR